MASPTKTQLLNTVYDLLKKRYKLEPRSGKFSLLEAVVYGICHEGSTREQANQAMSRFKDQFFDWNEVRVSALDEIRDVLAGLPDPEARARRIRRFLRQLFRKTYGFNLDPLSKKPQKDAVKQLKEYEAFQSHYVVATVIQQALGGHAIPIDASLRRVLARLRVTDAGLDDEALRGTLERAVPKNKGGDFLDLFQELAHDVCVEGEPDCPRCELRKVCPTGIERLSAKPSKAPKVASPPPPAPSPAPRKPGGKTPPTSPQLLPKATKPAPPAAPDAKAPKPTKDVKASTPAKPTPPAKPEASKGKPSRPAPPSKPAPPAASKPGPAPKTQRRPKSP